MTEFRSVRIAESRSEIAPDGSNVRVLLGLKSGSMAVFELPPGQVSNAVVHRTVDEIWLFLAGLGEMWRQQGAREEVTSVEPGVCVTIPVGTRFQLRARGAEPLRAVGVTMPPWPGKDQAIPVPGKWTPTVG